jgi:hypothetical protein
VTTTRKTNPLTLGSRDKRTATRRHEALIWENMLGTVYAQDETGDVRYFDYDWDAAIDFAGVSDCSDLRTVRWTGRANSYDHTAPRPRQFVLMGVR